MLGPRRSSKPRKDGKAGPKRRSVGAGFDELDARIEYHPKYGSRQNFGDYLPELICKRLLTYPKIDADVFRLIGSVIDGDRIRHNLLKVNGTTEGLIAFWCCGARSETPIDEALRAQCRFFGVRGPLTRDLLGLPGDTVMGDPGLLAPIFHAPLHHPGTAGRTICIPHFEDPKHHSEILRNAGTDVLVHAEVPASKDALCEILDKIASAEFVLTGSLHGAIIACAYGTPFAFWDNGHVDIPFKWRDFAGSVNMPVEFVRTLAEGRKAYAAAAKTIRIPPLAPILDICPFLARPSKLLEALCRDGDLRAQALLDAAAALEAFPTFSRETILSLQADSAAQRKRRAGMVPTALRTANSVLRTIAGRA